jgi:hypothetical protein
VRETGLGFVNGGNPRKVWPSGKNVKDNSCSPRVMQGCGHSGNSVQNFASQFLKHGIHCIPSSYLPDKLKDE